MNEYSDVLNQIATLALERELNDDEIEKLQSKSAQLKQQSRELLDKKRRIEQQLYNSDS